MSWYNTKAVATLDLELGQLTRPSGLRCQSPRRNGPRKAWQTPQGQEAQQF